MNIKIAAAGGIAALLFLSGCSSDSDEATAPTTSAAVESEMASEAPAAEEPGTIVDVAAAERRLRDPRRRGDRRRPGRDPVG